MWGQNGVTFRRYDLDQAPVVPSWSTGPVRVPFNALKQAGFLRRLFIQSPRTQYGITLVANPDPLAINGTEQDQPSLRAIQSLSLILQRVAPLYSLNRGIDLAFLEYMGCGRTFRTHKSGLGTMADLTQTNKTSLGKTSAAWDYISGIVAISAAVSTAQNIQFGVMADIPLTEYIKFPAGIVMDKNGSAVAVPETYGEVGLVTLQNSQQNVVLNVMLNPAWGLVANVNQTWLSTTANPTTPIAPLFNLWSEFYDVPENPQDWPPGYSFDYIIQYQSFDDPISAGKVIHKFDNAGMLMRAAYVFLDTNDKVVDVSNQAGDPATIAFKWGSSILHRNSSFQTNLSEALSRYGEPPLFGSLYHDFFTDDQSVLEMVNTAKITSPRCEITGAPGTATTMHTIEQRMIPVMIRQG